ncbi:Fumarase D [Pseudomonas sp. IT-P44]|jgi:hypothetical protein|uniref:hypothetical protein n=1 Tax=Pseudomonas TaxID=286 RepID=UPI000270758A|nr:MULTISPECIES: hypothetical protein [Pseudomonas]EJM78497.1 hypothetical protein PMI33_05585 [Pseudomonas sp. GM67]MBD9549831.1 hypothetical protein [Pseudomonas sp. PDM01]MBD9613022.1 hypothetical protein [Pseudomonas sp. PDM02]MCP1520703.1 hypothetical protein [Pseudomonas migulae]
MDSDATQKQAIWDQCAVEVMLVVLKSQQRFNYEVAAQAAADAADALIEKREARRT